MEIVELDYNDPLLFSFRKKIICSIFNADEKYLKEDIKYNVNIPEEVWKFSKYKWNSINFKSIYCLILNKEVISISGIKFYNNFLRMGMNYYTLPPYTKEARSILWKENGFIDQALNKYYTINGYFISIYAHNNKLNSWVKHLKKKKSFGQIGDTSAYHSLMRLNITDNPFLFNGVEQYIVYELFNNNKLDMLLKDLGVSNV